MTVFIVTCDPFRDHRYILGVYRTQDDGWQAMVAAAFERPEEEHEYNWQLTAWTMGLPGGAAYCWQLFRRRSDWTPDRRLGRCRRLLWESKTQAVWLFESKLPSKPPEDFTIFGVLAGE